MGTISKPSFPPNYYFMARGALERNEGQKDGKTIQRNKGGPNNPSFAPSTSVYERRCHFRYSS